MADDTTIKNAAATDEVIATDHVSSLNGTPITPSATTPKVQRVKVTYGDDGTARDVSATFPLPTYGPDLSTTGTITATDAVVAAPAGTGALVSGTSTAGSYVAIAAGTGDSAWNLQITGLTSGTLYFEVSLDSTNGVNGSWANVNGRQTGVLNTVLSGNTTTNGLFRGNTSGAAWFRVRSVGALSGTPAIVIRISDGVGAIFLNASIPSGQNSIGHVGPVVPLTTGTATGNIFRARVNPTAVTSSTALVAAPGAGLSIYVTDISISNAGATANLVSLLDGSTGVFDVFAAASGGGGVTNLGTPIKLTANTALNYTTSAASSTYISVTGYYAA